LEGSGDVLLSDDLGELLGAIFARQNGIAHAGRDDYTVAGRVRGSGEVATDSDWKENHLTGEESGCI
jgi:hypothetical protein